jgi:ABC-type transport system substrate-binding protein
VTVDRTRRRLALAAPALLAGMRARPGVAAPHETGSPHADADPAKVLRVALPVAATGFDPQASSDLYSDSVQRAIFEPLYGFDYLTRPYRRVPRIAAGLPDIADGGRTWTIRIRQGIHFADDPAFRHLPRELTADDFVYAWKRLLDPRMRSPFAWYLDGTIVGADAVQAKAKRDNRFDYDAPIEGLRALDRYTLRLALEEPDYILHGYLCSSPTAAVAREVIEAHGDSNGWAMAHPVGTGPYRLAAWTRGSQIVLTANPRFRGERYPSSAPPSDARLVAAMKGKTLPRIGRIEIAVMEESNPRLLAFDSNALDYVNLPTDLADRVLEPSGALRPSYVARGVRVERVTQPSLRYTYFNMVDPVVGGYDKSHIALRRAIAMAFNTPDLVRVIYQNQAEAATQPIPPGMPGHDPSLDVSVHFDPRGANAMLDAFGYRDRDGDGWRERLDGQPLRLTMGSNTTARDRDFDEMWQRSLKAVGIRIEFLKQKWPDLLKMGRAGQLQMWMVGWINTYGEGDAFMQLLYSGNIGQTNYSRFSLPEYDALYRRSRTLPDGPERNRLYRRMAELVAAYTPWVLGVYSVESTLVQPWLLGYRKNAYWEHPFEYFDLDAARRPAHGAGSA